MKRTHRELITDIGLVVIIVLSVFALGVVIIESVQW